MNNIEGLREALRDYSFMANKQFRSDPERDEVMHRQLQLIVLVMADCVLDLERVVKSICDDRP